MRKLSIALSVTAAMLLAGGLAGSAEATTWKTTLGGLGATAKNFSPLVQETACSGWGRHCPPGFTWRCNRWRGCWCRPC